MDWFLYDNGLRHKRVGNHIPLKVTYINRSIYILEFPTNCSFKGIWESKIQNVSF